MYYIDTCLEAVLMYLDTLHLFISKRHLNGTTQGFKTFELLHMAMNHHKTKSRPTSSMSLIQHLVCNPTRWDSKLEDIFDSLVGKLI